jgi:putative DNA primase/helicase
VSKPSINAGDLDLARVTGAAWAAVRISNSPPLIFRFGGGLSRIDTGDDGAVTAQSLTPDRLRHHLARMAGWYRRERGGRRRRDALPPLHVVHDMLACPDPPVPRLSRIVGAPVFAQDGSLRTTPGYDPNSQTYLASDVLGGESVPREPTGADVERANRLIVEELLGDFPFVADADRAHTVALLLLPFLREFIDGPTPLHLIEKPTPGTGASLLADVVTLPFLGRPAPVMTEASNEEEWRKRITAKLMTASPIVLLDNLRGRLDSAALSSAITGTTWEDRSLGRSETVHAPIRCAWMGTANNPSLSNEIARRSIRIRLDARMERPWLRNQFRRPDLRAWSLRHRRALVTAILTIGQAWLANDRPEGTPILGTFENWARVMGGVLSAIGVPGFLANLAALYRDADSEGAAWQRFVERWSQTYGSHPVGVAELWPLVNEDALDLDLGEGGERSQKTRLGKRLGHMRDRQFGERRIVAAGTLQGAARWRLQSVAVNE